MAETNSADFAGTVTRLGEEIVLLHDAWTQYKYLFAASPERVDLLNACARWFFALSQMALFREILLGISRLTDPLEQGKHTNLVLASLARSPELAERPEVAKRLN